MSRFNIVKNQRGDTIMEVLICVAMLGFMLGAAFSLTNKNQLSARASQERSEAVRLAEKQVEYLRTYYSKNPGATDIPPNNQFCFSTSTNPAREGLYTSNSDNSPNANKLLDTDDKYVTECKDDKNGYNYRINVWKAGTADTTALGARDSAHVVTVRWDNVKGGDPEEVKVFYSIEQSSAGYYGAETASGGGGIADPQCSDDSDNDSDGFNNYPADSGCTSPTDNTETIPAQEAVASMGWAEATSAAPPRLDTRDRYVGEGKTCTQVIEGWETDKFPTHNWGDNWICYNPTLTGYLSTFGAYSPPPAGDYSRCALLNHPSKLGAAYLWNGVQGVWTDNYICSNNSSVRLRFFTGSTVDPAWPYCLNITESSDPDWDSNPRVCLQKDET